MTKLKPREQGDIGELSAMEWLASKGAHIYVPVGHSPDVDLIAEIAGVVLRIEVKTTTHRRDDRWGVLISTRGGNQSWTGVAKYFDRSRCDYLFVHVGDGGVGSFRRAPSTVDRECWSADRSTRSSRSIGVAPWNVLLRGPA
jgi:Holliday junction resolvase-like predicted endonuclease